MGGIETALEEITLVLFTTLAPAGAAAFFIMAAVMLRSHGEVQRRIRKCLLLPLFVSMAGLIASATHLGNPDNALYVFSHVGSSPLSNEVLFAVIFLGLAGTYWIYQFADHVNPFVQRVWIGAVMVSALLFVGAIACAYDARTIATWSSPLVPWSVGLNALVGGPSLALVGLGLAKWRPTGRAAMRILLAVSVCALAANTVVYSMQGTALASVTTFLGNAAQLVPHYGAMLTAFSALCSAGIVLAWWPTRQPIPGVARASVASVLVFAGIFIMRFAFYMAHMTSGM